MKKTSYFSGSAQTHLVDSAIQIATDKRDAFIEANKDIIGAIDSEDIKIFGWTNQNQALIVILRLTYFPK